MATTLLLEGDDLEALLIRARHEAGADARIVRAEKVRGGGFMGFFAKEHFEVAVEVNDDESTGEDGSAPRRDRSASGAPPARPEDGPAPYSAAVYSSLPGGQPRLPQASAEPMRLPQASAEPMRLPQASAEPTRSAGPTGPLRAAAAAYGAAGAASSVVPTPASPASPAPAAVRPDERPQPSPSHTRAVHEAALRSLAALDVAVAQKAARSATRGTPRADDDAESAVVQALLATLAEDAGAGARARAAARQADRQQPATGAEEPPGRPLDHERPVAMRVLEAATGTSDVHPFLASAPPPGPTSPVGAGHEGHGEQEHVPEFHPLSGGPFSELSSLGGGSRRPLHLVPAPDADGHRRRPDGTAPGGPAPDGHPQVPVTPAAAGSSAPASAVPVAARLAAARYGVTPPPAGPADRYDVATDGGHALPGTADLSPAVEHRPEFEALLERLRLHAGGALDDLLASSRLGDEVPQQRLYSGRAPATRLAPLLVPPVDEPDTPAVAEPAVAEPDVVPAVVEPGAVAPVGPAVVEPEVVEPAVVEPEVVEPVAAAVIAPAVAEPPVVEPAVPVQPTLFGDPDDVPAGPGDVQPHDVHPYDVQPYDAHPYDLQPYDLRAGDRHDGDRHADDRGADEGVAAARRTLRDAGVPASWARRYTGTDRFSGVLAVLERMPVLDIDPDTPVVAVVGPAHAVTLEAHRIAIDLADGDAPRPVVVVPTRPGAARRAAVSTARRTGPPVVVAVTASGYDDADTVLDTLQAVGAGAVLVVVDGSAPLEATQSWIDALDRVDALVVEGADAVRPAAVLGLDLPVIRMDGVPLDRVTWTALLCAQLEVGAAQRDA